MIMERIIQRMEAAGLRMAGLVRRPAPNCRAQILRCGRTQSESRLIEGGECYTLHHCCPQSKDYFAFHVFECWKNADQRNLRTANKTGNVVSTLKLKWMKLSAERVGFEPTLEFPLNTLSKRAPSATRPSLRRRLGPESLYRHLQSWLGTRAGRVHGR